MSGFRIKTASIILITILMTTITYLSPALAQDTPATGASTPNASESYLKEIRDILLNNINKLPTYLNQLTKMALSWLAPDDSEATSTLQNSFAALTQAKLANSERQLKEQHTFLKDFLRSPSQEKFPDANDLTYQTLLNQPYFSSNSQDQLKSAYSYIRYASGLNMQHERPISNWIEEDKKKRPAIGMYINYYNTVSAVQTYNGYILSELYAEAQNNNLSKQLQNSLIQQASNSNWFTQIASEKVGIVLRQILLYNSQTYVLLAQLLETQKKLLAAQAMNNALLIAVNQEAENRIYNKMRDRMPA